MIWEQEIKDIYDKRGKWLFNYG